MTYNAEAEAVEAAAAVASDPATPSKRDLGFNDDCGPQPDGYGPYIEPDTPEAFVESTLLAVSSFTSPVIYIETSC